MQLTKNAILPAVAFATALRLSLIALLCIAFLRTRVDLEYPLFLYVPVGEARQARIIKINNSFVDRLTLFDGQQYADIARNGYRRIPNRNRTVGNFAWFPLLPSIVWLGDRIGDGVTIAIVVNNCCAVLAAVLVWRSASCWGIAGWVVVLLLSAFPTSIFQSLLYTEGVFLLLSVGTAVCVLTGRFWLAAFVGLLCGLCRPQGVLVAMLPASRILSGFATYSTTQKVATVTAAVAPVLGLLVFATICWRTIGSPIAFLQIQTIHGREYAWAGLFHGIVDIFRFRWPLTDMIGTLLAIGMLPVIWRHLPRPLFVYALALILMPMSTGTIMSMGRFMSVSFPVFLALAKLLQDRPRLFYTTLSLFLVVQGATVFRAMRWDFVG